MTGNFAQGYTIEAQIGAAAFPWMLCARWGSLVLCLALVLVTAFARRRQANGEAGDRQHQSSRQAA